jgi:hypothetical protein
VKAGRHAACVINGGTELDEFAIGALGEASRGGEYGVE